MSIPLPPPSAGDSPVVYHWHYPDCSLGMVHEDGSVTVVGGVDYERHCHDRNVWLATHRPRSEATA